MRYVLWCLALAACSSDLGPTGFATFTGPEPVVSARVTGSYVTYNGTPLRAWTITLSNADGCMTTDKTLALEINLGADGTPLPLGDIPLRAAEPIQSLPSGLFRYNDAVLTSGTITLDSVSSTRITGEFSASTSAGDFMGEFDGPVCSTE